MPPTAFGRTSRFVALVLLLVSLWTSSHRQQDDDACLPAVAGEHDASKHAFAPSGSSDHEHCAVCHWMRGLKPAFTDTGVTTSVLRQAGSLSAPIVAVHAAPASGRLPARAPPSALL